MTSEKTSAASYGFGLIARHSISGVGLRYSNASRANAADQSYFIASLPPSFDARPNRVAESYIENTAETQNLVAGDAPQMATKPAWLNVMSGVVILVFAASLIALYFAPNAAVILGIFGFVGVKFVGWRVQIWRDGQPGQI